MRHFSELVFNEISIICSYFAGAADAGAGRGAAAATAADSVAAAAPEGLSPGATDVFNIGAFPVTNSMLVTWIVALGVILFARLATRNMKEVPEGAQNFWEWMVESLYDFLEDVLGADLVKKTFWFFATIFIFIFFTNWFGLIPGVGTIGWGAPAAEGFEVTRPLLRGGNADLNMTSAMAADFHGALAGLGLASQRPRGDLSSTSLAPRATRRAFIKYFMIMVFFLVGFIELLSIAFRPISLSFRLYGNIFAGENLLDAMSRAVQHPAWARAVFSALLPVPFYFMELLVGLVQALVFMLLTAVFTGVICTHEEAHGEAHH